MRPEHARLAGLQGVIIISGAANVYFVASAPAAKSFVYGGCVTLTGTLFFAWRLRRGESRETENAMWYLRLAYRTALQRYVGTVFLLATGFKLFKLAPLWLLAGFVIGQAAWLLTPVWTRLRTQNDKRSADLDRLH